jgi:hypothetical protein
MRHAAPCRQIPLQHNSSLNWVWLVVPAHLRALDDPEALMHSALIFGALRARPAVDQRVAGQVAKLLTSNDLGRLNAGIKILSQKPGLSEGIRNADAAISSIVARGSLPTVSAELRH